MGYDIIIEPGAVNWMTAGKGVVHSERTPDELRTIEKKLHGLQIWIALPKDKEEMEPEFFHIDAKDLPIWQEDTLQFKDRKSTRLNSSHVRISYAVFCLKKKNVYVKQK